jgi:hypothetical protein
MGVAVCSEILIRERIQIVHGHQTTSALAHECILHARTMGYKVFTPPPPPSSLLPFTSQLSTLNSMHVLVLRWCSPTTLCSVFPIQRPFTSTNS